MTKVEMFGLSVAPTRTSKALCVITAGVAFVLGTVIGVLIPLYVLPPLYSAGEVAHSPSPLPPQNAIHNFVNVRSNSLHPLTKPPPPAIFEDTTTVSGEVLDEAVPMTGGMEESSTEAPATANKTEGRQVVDNSTLEEDEINSSSLTDGIFWSEQVEAIVPGGFDDRSVEQWRRFCNHSAVIKIEEGCGRMRNRLLTFENGTQSCCRYRQNFDQIQGDIFSFFLSRILGIRNLPPTSMMLVQPRTWQWSSIRSELSLAQWAEDRPVVLTSFLDQLSPAYIPQSLRAEERRLHPVDLELRDLSLGRDRHAIIELAQWSDLIVFDYLTANLDRIVNNLYNMQWNPTMMDSPTHNLARDPTTGQLIFLDNESGLLHGYRLLDKYEPYHRAMLDALCIFRRSTVQKIREFRQRGDIGQLLRDTFRRTNPEMHNYLPTLPDRSIKILNSRIQNVYEVMERCERTYPSTASSGSS